MARMGDQPQPAGADHTYSPYHVKRSAKNGGSRGPGGK